MASEVRGCKMTREQTLLQVADNLSYFNDCKFPFAVSECKKWINKIYDDFDHIAEILVKANEEEISRHFNEVEKLTKQHEEELKKAYIEGSNDCFKALKDAGKLK